MDSEELRDLVEEVGDLLYRPNNYNKDKAKELLSRCQRQIADLDNGILNKRLDYPPVSPTRLQATEKKVRLQGIMIDILVECLSRVKEEPDDTDN